MKKRLLSLILAGAMLVSMAACGSREEKKKDSEPKSLVEVQQSHGDSGDAVNLPNEEEKEYPEAKSYNGSLSQGINGFAYDMAEQLNKQKEDENYFFSPYSLCAALTLLNNAAAGDTLSQINEVMGVASLEDWNQQLSLLMKQEQPEEAKLTAANSLWLAKGYEPSTTFYDTYYPLVSAYFDAALFEADYKDNPEQVADQMNQWISEATEGMIADFVDEVDKETVLTLINAVYFYGEWCYKFETTGTWKQNFYDINGAESKVEMMHQGDIYLNYLSQDGMHAISMPYGDGSKVMNILVQNTGDGRTAPDIFSAYSEEEKNTFLHDLMNAEEQKITTLAIPKFEMEYTVEALPELLQQLGMVDAFKYPAAELPHISSDAYVTDVSHMAKIEVDEEGSKAAAVTIIETADGCAPMPEGEIIEFIADRPFLFFIQDVESEVILFSGQINML